MSQKSRHSTPIRELRSYGNIARDTRRIKLPNGGTVDCPKILSKQSTDRRVYVENVDSSPIGKTKTIPSWCSRGRTRNCGRGRSRISVQHIHKNAETSTDFVYIASGFSPLRFHEPNVPVSCSVEIRKRVPLSEYSLHGSHVNIPTPHGKEKPVSINDPIHGKCRCLCVDI
jgi:hypothetical protein